jgi:hypothetical protein
MLLLEGGELRAGAEEMGSVLSGMGEGWRPCEAVCDGSHRRRRGEKGMTVGRARRSRELGDGVGLRSRRRRDGVVWELSVEGSRMTPGDRKMVKASG